MSEDKSPTQRYLERASPKEQQRFANALLDAQARTRADFEVSEVVVRASRLLSVIPLAAVVLIAVLAQEPRFLGAAVLFAGAWFPNEVAAATGRLGMRTWISRPSHPGVLLAIVWLFLIVLTVGAAVGAIWGMTAQR